MVRPMLQRALCPPDFTGLDGSNPCPVHYEGGRTKLDNTGDNTLGDTMAIPSSAWKNAKRCGHFVDPCLTRTWQILLKGMDEVAQGPLPECALEMILIRVTHVKSF